MGLRRPLTPPGAISTTVRMSPASLAWDFERSMGRRGGVRACQGRVRRCRLAGGEAEAVDFADGVFGGGDEAESHGGVSRGCQGIFEHHLRDGRAVALNLSPTVLIV